MRERLMTPGPTEVHDAVLAAMSRPVINHGDSRFHEVMDRTCDRMARIVGTTGPAVLLPASGRGGIEAAFTTALVPGERLLIVHNGVFGTMLAAIARRCRIAVSQFESEPGRPLDLDRLDAAAGEPGLAALAVVHAETSTGVLNPIRDIGEIARRRGLVYIVDAVSSAGGAEIRMDDWGIDILCTGSQKCLGSLAGLAPVAAADRMWDRFDARPGSERSFYFDLARWRDMWFPRERGGRLKFGYRRQPMTMPTHLIYALDTATQLIEEEGIGAVVARHAAAARVMRAALPGLGCGLFPDEEIACPTVTAILPPPGVAEADIRRELRERHGILAAGGLEEYHGRMFRFGHMGVTASLEYVDAAVAALRDVLGR